MKLTAEKAKILASEAREKATKAKKEKVPEVLEYVLKDVTRSSNLGLYRHSFYNGVFSDTPNIFSCDVNLLVEELTKLGFKCVIERINPFKVLHVSWFDG